MAVLVLCNGNHKKQYVSTCEIVPYIMAQYGDNNGQSSSDNFITIMSQ